MLRNAWEIEAAMTIYRTLAAVELTFLEAQVLHWCLWKDAPAQAVADFLDVRAEEVLAARRSLLEKVAAVMGPMEEELARLPRRVAAGG